MRTIGKHWPKGAPKGDFQVLCDYCGTQFRRSVLRRDRGGLLACPSDFGGDVVEISEANAAAAQRPLVIQSQRDGGGFDHLGDPDPVNPNPPTVVRPP